MKTELSPSIPGEDAYELPCRRTAELETMIDAVAWFDAGDVDPACKMLLAAFLHETRSEHGLLAVVPSDNPNARVVAASGATVEPSAYSAMLRSSLEARGDDDDAISAITTKLFGPLPTSRDPAAEGASSTGPRFLASLIRNRSEVVGLVGVGPRGQSYSDDERARFDALARLCGVLMEGDRRRRRGLVLERERHMAKAAMREIERRHQTLEQLAPVGIFRADAAGNYVLVNDWWCLIAGIGPSHALGLGWKSALHPDDRERVAASWLESVQRGGSFQSEYRFLHADGTLTWVLVQAVAEATEEGAIDGFVGAVTDVTERKTAEKALAQSEARFRGLVSSAPDPLLVVDEGGRIVLANTRATQLFGASQTELVGKPIYALVPERFRTSHPFSQAWIPEGESEPPPSVADELRGLRKDGSEFPIELSLSHLQTDQGRLLVMGVHDISERLQAEAARREKEEAQRVSRAKTEFLSRVSHELRTPLNAILGFAQVLEMSSDLDTKHRNRVGHILTAGRHLLGLINEVLDISRIEAGTLSITQEPVVLGKLIAETVEMIRLEAARRNITVEIHDRRTFDYEILADRQRLKQVLLNLLSNAVKYNREGGRVDVVTTPANGGRTKIQVSDTGPGIKADQVGKLFTPFERLGAERMEVEGTGLGLAVSKALIELMGGRIDIESTVGLGSTFWVELPHIRRPAHLSSMPPQSGAPALATLPRTLLRRQTVLYIEDNLSNVYLVQDILVTGCGVHLIFATTGAEGVELARLHRPNLVLLDWNLPDGSGEDVLKSLRAIPEVADTPVVVVSADAQAVQIHRMIRAGARAYLSKPLIVAELMDVIQELLQPELRPE